MLWDLFTVRKEEQFQQRIKILGVAIGLCFSLMILRLVYLQVVHGDYYRGLSARNRVHLLPIKAQRGLIYDRAGNLLVGNVPAFAVSLIPAELPKEEKKRTEEFLKLQEYLGIPPEDLENKLRQRKWRYFEPLRIQSNVSRETATQLEEHQLDLPGVVVLTESRRHYKFEQLAFHVLGYVGEISESDLAIREGYQAGDIIGQAGVEKVYDHYLKGRNGWLHIERDALGRQRGVLGREEPWAGYNLILTLNRELQEKAESLLLKKKGAIVAVDVRNGEILAMASSPSYNSNNFTQGISQKEWDQLCRDPSYPLTNRVIQGFYPPGSIFKIVTLLAGLEEKLVTPDEHFFCKGIFWISTWPYRCWLDAGHGMVDARRSLIESCDVYYYFLGLRVKVDKIAKWARAFGYGSPTGVDLPNEVAGLVPSPQWKERTQNMPWFPGNTAMLAIGQGYLLGTPIQLLNIFCAVANNGIIYRPHLLRQVVSHAGTVMYAVKPEVMFTVKAAPEHWRLIQESLTDVVNSKHGTGKNARVSGVLLAGKTATAQNPHGEDHAAFAAYAPAGRPEIAVAIYLENAGGGGYIAAPMAKAMMEVYFGKSAQ